MRTTEQRLLNAVARPAAYEEHVIHSAGAPIVLSVWPGRPGRPTVVFLPGTMTHPLFYEELLDALNRNGFTVVGVHSQGHGKSPRVRRPLTFEVLLANARDSVTWARTQRPAEPVAVLGSSQGGVLAMAVAASGDPLDAVLAHNVLDPSLPSSLAITRFPTWLARAYPAITRTISVAGRVAPRLPVPFDAYLDIRRVCRDEADAEFFYTDPLGLRAYPLGFLASLFTADLSGMRDGSIRCPVTVLAGRGDPLFPLAYTEEVYARIAAASKELVVVDSDAHLLFNEDLDAVLPVLQDRLSSLVPAAARSGGGRG